MAIGQVGRCPRERPGPGPDTARIANVAIGDVAAESMMEGARGGSEVSQKGGVGSRRGGGVSLRG